MTADKPVADPKPQIPRLNAIVDVEASIRAGWRPLDVAKAFLDGGARFLQLRAKTIGSGEFLELAATIVGLAQPAGAALIVNDRADVAQLAGAAGVHVGHDDLSPREVRTIVGESATVGVSTHTVDQVDRALDQPVNYIAIGPVFGSVTKSTGYDRVGLVMVGEAARRARSRGLPIVAIGGITLFTAPSVIDAGAASVAVIGDLLTTGDPASRVREYLRALG